MAPYYRYYTLCFTNQYCCLKRSITGKTTVGLEKIIGRDNHSCVYMSGVNII